MACDYCWLSLNEGPAVVLDEAVARRAVREHLARFGAKAQVTLLGGEPLIHVELVRSILKEVRGRAPVAVATNGTRACPEVLKELSDLGASIVLSLDGAPESHDARRPLVGSEDSSHAEILRTLEASDVPLRVNMVVTAATAPALLRNVEYLRSRGFKRLSFHPHVLEKWTTASLAELKAALDGFVRYYRALPPGALELTHLSSYARRLDVTAQAAEQDDDAILGADGNYYPCDGLFVRPYRELRRFAAEDLEKIARVRRLARLDIHLILEYKPHYTCPREPYFHALATGADQSDAVRRFHQADLIFGGALARLAETKEALRGR